MKEAESWVLVKVHGNNRVLNHSQIASRVSVDEVNTQINVVLSPALLLLTLTLRVMWLLAMLFLSLMLSLRDQGFLAMGAPLSR